MNRHLKTMSAAALAAAIALTFGIGSAGAAPPPSSAASMASYVASNQQAGSNWFGGPVYSGTPDLAGTAALVKAGGGADHFDFATALVAMLGKDTVNKEVAKLTKQYGAAEVKTFLGGMTFAINDGL